MLRIGIHTRSFDAQKLGFFKSIIDLLLGKGIEVVLSNELKSFLQANGHHNSNWPFFHGYADLYGIDYLISVGGDGTLLDAVTKIKDHQIPILGVNIGRLGFLATTAVEDFERAIDAILQGSYEIDERILIQVDANKDIFEGLNFGLNEFTILKRDTSSMIIVHTFLNGEFLNTYWADGLIVATPTGSTGYSLSVGGPVVIPHSHNFIIAPVSPHNLNVRPLIVSDTSTISFKIEGRSKNFLVSLDSRSKKVDDTIQLSVRKCNFKVGLVKLAGDNFLKTLRKKLNWGYDIRN